MTNHRNVLTTVALLAAAAPLTLVLTACGDDASSSGDGDAGDGAASPAAAEVTYEGADPDTLVTCLADAGVPSVLGDSVPLGVEVPVVGVEAEGGATLWVFRTEADASDNRFLITLSEEDTPSSRLAGNVVVRYDDPEVAPTTEVDACLA
jgi:hypothetical protein